jgi:hypothetical protein
MRRRPGGVVTTRTVVLADGVAKAGQIVDATEHGRQIDVGVLVCRPGGMTRRSFSLRQAVEVLRLPRRRQLWLIRATFTGRARLTLRSLTHKRVLCWLRRGGWEIGLHASSTIYRATTIGALRRGILNAHIGALPRYRGRSVLEWSVLMGDPTGITTFFIDTGIDTGREIVTWQPVDVSQEPSLTTAKEHLFGLDGQMYASAVDRLHAPNYVPTTNRVNEGQRWYVMSELLSGAAEVVLAGMSAQDVKANSP